MRVVTKIFFFLVVSIQITFSSVVLAQPAQQFVPGEYILKYSNAALAQIRNEVPGYDNLSDEEIKAEVNVRLGLVALENLELVNAQVVELENGAELNIDFARRLKAAGILEYIEPQFILSIGATANDSFFTDLWGMHNSGQLGGTADMDIDAPEAWSVSTGNDSIIVGVVDTGIDYTHPDLSGNMWVNAYEIPNNGIDDDANGIVDDIYGYNARSNSGDPLDDNYHGTHCAGTIGASGNNSAGVAGVAWNVRLMALKFLGSTGSGRTSDAIKAIEYAVNMRKRGENLRVLNNSWGGGAYSLSLRDAVQAAEEAGILFVAAAGNSGLNADAIPHYPANYDVASIISVAAVDRNGALASFSNYGASTVHIAAPGVSIKSTWPGNQYKSISGTSMAAPHVSGVAALLFSERQGLSPLQAKDILLGTKQSVAALNGKVLTGGLVNAYNALSTTNTPPAISAQTNHVVSASQGSLTIPVSISDADGDQLTKTLVIDPAGAAAFALDTNNDLRDPQVGANYYFNSWGYNEKWLTDQNGFWYILMPRGTLYQYVSISSVPLVARLTPSYHVDPALLHEASTTYVAPGTGTLSSAGIVINLAPTFRGTFDANLSVADGMHHSVHRFEITVVDNQAPVLAAVGNKNIMQGEELQIAISAFDADGDQLTFHASAAPVNNAPPAQFSWNGSNLLLAPVLGFSGDLTAKVTVSDGTFSVSRSFTVSVQSNNETGGEPGDADGDGISDQQEVEDGTDPYDRGSFLKHLSNPTHIPWNGFLEMVNILELVNADYSAVNVTLSLYAQDGSLAHSEAFTVGAQSQRDIIVNDLPGFTANSYGILKVEFDGNLDGRLSFYRADSVNGGFEFAFSVPLANATTGASVVSFNTFQPSMHSADQQNGVANWLSIINLANAPKVFTINTFGQSGLLIAARDVTVPAFGRIDVDGGHNIAGPSVVGSHQIRPLDVKAPYIGQLVRYGMRADGGFDFAFPLIAKAGNGRTVHVPTSRRFQESNWVELVNTLDKSVSVNVVFTNDAGTIVGIEEVSLSAHAQVHMAVDAYLNEGESGVASITPDLKNSVIAQSMFYFRDSAQGSIQAMYGSQSQESLGNALIGSYNLYLRMENWMKVSNTGSETLLVTVTVNTALRAVSRTIGIPANGTTYIPLHDSDTYQTEANSYGAVSLRASRMNSMLSELVRVGFADGQHDFAMPTLVR